MFSRFSLSAFLFIRKKMLRTDFDGIFRGDSKERIDYILSEAQVWRCIINDALREEIDVEFIYANNEEEILRKFPDTHVRFQSFNREKTRKKEKMFF